MLIHAARDLLAMSRDGCRIVQAVNRCNARAWFESKEYCKGSFLWIADVLQVDADTFRRKLLRRANGGATPAPADGRAA